MYILYLDESGQHSADYFVLAGVAVFETQTYWISKKMDELQDNYFKDAREPIEFHITDIRAGKKPPWDNLNQEQRIELISSIYNIFNQEELAVFGVAVSRKWLKKGESEYDYAFESVVKLFDDYLSFKYHQSNERQRGLVVVAESQYRKNLEAIGKQIRYGTTRWGNTNNMAEIPLFTSARNSRLLQLADACANGIWGRYENGYTKYYDVIAPRFFYSYEGRNCITGKHLSNSYSSCLCPLCLTNRVQNRDTTQS